MAKGKINVIRGKILIDHGKVQTCRCCGVPCQYCTSTTPKTMTVVLSGIDYCQCSLNEPGRGVYTYSKITVVPNIDPNGSFVLTQSATDPCWWLVDIPLSQGQVTWYEDVGCTGSSAGPTTLTRYSVQYIVEDGYYDLYAYYGTNAAPVIYTFDNYEYDVVGDLCPGTRGTMANFLDRCDYSAGVLGNNYFDGNGTATVNALEESIFDGGFDF